MIAEGEGYQIAYEELVPSSGTRRFAIVAFPRSLKHHVLLHVIFGHELGHTAQDTAAVGALVEAQVRDVMSSVGPLSNSAAAITWIRDAAAPADIPAQLAAHRRAAGAHYEFTEQQRQSWLTEFICDLFGLLLFGPGFVAAHRVLLRPAAKNPYGLNASHPPYAVRHRMLARSLALLGWDKPTLDDTAGRLYDAESDCLQLISDDPYSAWASVFTDTQLHSAIRGIQGILVNHGHLEYSQITSETMLILLQRLLDRLPPIAAEIEADGAPSLKSVPMAHTLYAGWVYWLGRSKITADALSFLNTNKLCDQALVQELAISTART